MPRPRLVLIRHAQAGSPEDWGGADRDRPLTGRGLVSAGQMATALSGLLPLSSLVLTSSPWLRARQTAAPLAGLLGVPVRQKKWLAPGQFAGLEVQAELAELPEDGVLVIVGHEPDLSSLAGRLLGLRQGDAAVHLGKGDACALAGALPGPMQLVWHLPRRVLERLAMHEEA